MVNSGESHRLRESGRSNRPARSSNLQQPGMLQTSHPGQCIHLTFPAWRLAQPVEPLPHGCNATHVSPWPTFVSRTYVPMHTPSSHGRWVALVLGARIVPCPVNAQPHSRSQAAGRVARRSTPARRSMARSMAPARHGVPRTCTQPVAAATNEQMPYLHVSIDVSTWTCTSIATAKGACTVGAESWLRT